MERRSAPVRRRSGPRRRRSSALLFALILLLASAAAAQDSGVREAVAASYAAWQAGEHEAARDRAREAIRLDDGVATLVARRVLILALQALDEPQQALAEIDQYLAFELLPKDRAWAEDLAVTLRASLPEPEPGEPEPEPEPEPVEPEPEPIEPSAPDSGAAPALVVAVGGGFQQLGPWSYGAVDAEVSVRLAAPLRLAVGYQLGLVGGQPCDASGPGDCVAALSSLSVGPQLRFALPVQPFVGAGFLAAFNGGESPYAPVMLGFDAGGGVAFAPGPVGVRVGARFRLLSRPIGEVGSPRPGALLTVDLELRVGR